MKSVEFYAVAAEFPGAGRDTGRNSEALMLRAIRQLIHGPGDGLPATQLKNDDDIAFASTLDEARKLARAYIAAGFDEQEDRSAAIYFASASESGTLCGRPAYLVSGWFIERARAEYKPSVVLEGEK